MPTMPRQIKSNGYATQQQQRRQHDRDRGSARARGYTSRWDRAAKRFKADNPLCVGCLAVEKTVEAKVVDHIMPHRGDMELFWSPSNWQAACAWHHDVVKQRLEIMHNDGEAVDADLKLSSDKARELTLALMP